MGSSYQFTSEAFASVLKLHGISFRMTGAQLDNVL